MLESPMHILIVMKQDHMSNIIIGKIMIISYGLM